MPALVERHRQIAARLLLEGQAAHAFGELVRASRALPMTPRLASALVTFSLRAGTEAAAIALLSSALAHTQGETRRSVRLQLARVLRRVNQLPRAVEALQALVDETPGDRRARRLLDVLFRRLERDGRTESQEVPIVQGESLADEWAPPQDAEVPPAPPGAPTVEDSIHRSATVELPALWQEDEHTVEASGPPNARFTPRAPEPRAEPPKAPEAPKAPAAPEPPADDRHKTVLEMAAPWAQEEATSEASGLPFAIAAPPAVPPRDDATGDASNHRRTTIDVPPLPEEDEETAAESPAPRRASPLIPPPPGLRMDGPVPWSIDEDTQPSRQLVPRQENPEETRVEAQLIARQAWRELAQFYLDRADRAKDLGVRAETLTRLAELLEDELQDPAGAARVYGQILDLTGDRAALAEQVRLLSQRADSDDWSVRRVLDEAVQRASNPRARATAFLARGERLLASGEKDRARSDFEAVVAISPHSLPALMGLARCVPEADRAKTAERLRAALAAVPRRTAHRAEGLRCLAELAGGSLADARLGHWAWSEVLAENPEDLLAQDQLLELTRKLGDKEGLSRVLRARLAREPRGPSARKARLELVATLEASGDSEGSLAELRQAVRFEPGHKEAWLLLVERLISLGKNGEAAWAMEHAATATEDDDERLGTWERLARFCREVLGDAARSQVYANRAENLRKAIAERAAPALHPEPPRSAAPKRETSGSRTSLLMPPPGAVELTPTPAAAAPAPAPAPESAPTVLEMPAIVLPTPAKPEAPASKAAAPAPKAAAPASKEAVPLGGEPASVGRTAIFGSKEVAAPAKESASAGKTAVFGSKEAVPLGGEPASVGKTAIFGSKDVVPPAKDPASAGKTAAPVSKEAVPPGKESASSNKTAIFGSKDVAPPAKEPASASKAAAPVSKEPVPASPVPELAPEPPSEPVAVEGTRVIAWEAPPGKMEPARRRAPVAPASPASPVTSSKPAVPPAPAPGLVPVSAPGLVPVSAPAAAPAAVETARPAAIERVRERPLDATAYRELSAFFSGRGDPARGSLMMEVALALTGEKGGVPRPPNRTLTPEERAGLRHPGLRNPAGELLASVGQALCRLFPTFGRAAGSSEPLRPDSGPGARACLEVLQSVARLLDVPLPEVFLSEDDGPPFSLVHPGAPRLLVGRLAVRQVLPEPELRFFAGRALSCLGPDLLSLRCLRKDQLLRAVAILASVLRGGTEFGPEARVVREALHPKARERSLVLLEPAMREFDAAALAEAARHSANRAGLVACGGPGPAVAALRALKSSEPELVELVRFSASERYLPLRG